jgi:hypothetical protein
MRIRASVTETVARLCDVRRWANACAAVFGGYELGYRRLTCVFSRWSRFW